MGKKKRHHVVSRGLQRLFAEEEQVLLIDKSTLTYTRAGTNDVFVEGDFNSWRDRGRWNPELEDEWMRIEDIALPRVRRLSLGQEEQDDRLAAKAMAALHFARSFDYRAVHERLVVETFEFYARNATGDDRLVELFRRHLGRDVTELEEYVSARAELLKQSRIPFVEGQVRVYRFALRMLDQLKVQLLTPNMSRIGFVLGDSPVVTLDKNGFKVGVRSGLALGDTFAIFMPLGRHLGMTFWSGPARKDEVIAPYQTQLANLWSWRAANRYLIADPRMDNVPPSCAAPQRNASTERRKSLTAKADLEQRKDRRILAH